MNIRPCPYYCGFFIEWFYWCYSEEFIWAVFTQTQNFSEYYPDELYVWKQMSKWAGPDIKGLYPARSFIQSLCNVWLTQCVNKGGHCQEQGFPLEDPKEKLSFPGTQIYKTHHELPQHLLRYKQIWHSLGVAVKKIKNITAIVKFAKCDEFLITLWKYKQKWMSHILKDPKKSCNLQNRKQNCDPF